jgi:hypothetical protein
MLIVSAAADDRTSLRKLGVILGIVFAIAAIIILFFLVNRWFEITKRKS